MVDIYGERLTMKQLAVLANVEGVIISKRLCRGFTPEEAILGRRHVSTPSKEKRSGRFPIMNLLSVARRDAIQRLSAGGASIREISELLGISHGTVARYVGGRGSREREMTKLVDELVEELRRRDIRIDAPGIEPLRRLHQMVHYECDRHPEAEPSKDFERNGACRICRGAAMQRAHKKRHKRSAD